MDPCDLIERLEQIAASYRAQAALFVGRRRNWRLKRAQYLDWLAEAKLHRLCKETI